ncbi:MULTISPECIES: hypothetical protein [unclassified Roseovarius]|jgi:hypothetical protein|uniref:hypothetical protein n=1 Tax=unclassified Roseovarius TaxID=2614913 RepID=UPI0000684E1E|nr:MULTISPECIES: hypothetical protein [unclassified Roseovarius]EAQ25578.1 hypothetical protein ROS217_07460 [Roseovarius sp. 217]KJS44645.1 MAG: hypothetical protein VR71_05400 [Roseovarius sp. BRH_c41]
MDDLETKLRQAGDELRSIRCLLDTLKSIPVPQREEEAGALTFRSVREKGTFHSVREEAQSTKHPKLDTLNTQFTKLADLDHFVFFH